MAKAAATTESSFNASNLMKLLAGVLLLPWCYGCALAFAKHMPAFANNLGHSMEIFVGGMAFYLLVHFLMFKPKAGYVYGHEMSHAVWTWLFLGRVNNIQAAKDGGQISTTKTNFLIELAPYFFPFYAFLLLGLYKLLCWLIPGLSGDYKYIFLFLLGATWCFHLVLTLSALKEEQSDIKKNGMLFSLVIIFIVNMQSIIFILSASVTGLDSFVAFNRETWSGGYHMSEQAYRYLAAKL